MTATILLLAAALMSARVTPRAFAALRTAHPEIPLAFLEHRLVL